MKIIKWLDLLNYRVKIFISFCKALNSPNPFTYSASGNQVNGNVKTLSLTSCNGEPLKIEDSSEPFTLWMDGMRKAIRSINLFIFFLNATNIWMEAWYEKKLEENNLLLFQYDDDDDDEDGDDDYNNDDLYSTSSDTWVPYINWWYFKIICK